MKLAVYSLMGDLRTGVAIARGEALDLVRRTNTRRQQVLYGLLLLVLLPAMLLFVRQGYALGVETRDGIDAPVVAVVRNLLVPAMLAFAVLGGLGAAQSLARDPVQPLLLTSAPTRAIVVGKLLYLLGTWLVPMSLFFLPAVAYAVGAQSPLFPVALVVFGVPVLLLTLLVGLTLAYLLWIGIARLGLPEYARRIVTAAISLVIFVVAFTFGFLSGQVGDSVEQLPTGDPVVPVGWYADLLFLGSPVAEPLGVHSLSGAGVILAGIPVAFVVLVRIAPEFWYGSPETKTDDADEFEMGAKETRTFDSSPSESVGRTHGITGRSRTLRTAFGYARSLGRRPDQYVYLLYYVFPILGILLPIALEAPSMLAPALGAGLVVLGVWLAGSLFCLNPLGTEGSMLSQLVLADRAAKTFVHARLLLGILTGVLLGSAGLGLYVATGPVVPTQLALVAAPLLAGVVVASAAFALGLGSALPKFETIEVFDSVETLAPSIVAALVHGAVALVFVFAALAVSALVTLSESPLSTLQRAVTLGTFVLALFVVTDGSRRYAIATFGQYGNAEVRVDRTFSVYAAVVLSVLAVALGQSVGLSVALLVGVDRPLEILLPVLFVAEYLGYALVAAGFLYVTRRGLSYLDLGWPSVREVGIILAGVLASLAIYATGLALISGLGLPVAEHALFDTDDADPRLFLALIPLMLFVNAPVEELLYRNVIQKYLDEWFSSLSSVLIASVVFAVSHLPAYFTADLQAAVVTLTLLFVVSCLWGALYVKTSSLFVISAVHGLYNATLVGGAYLWLVL